VDFARLRWELGWLFDINKGGFSAAGEASACAEAPVDKRRSKVPEVRQFDTPDAVLQAANEMAGPKEKLRPIKVN
jgi:hypothetical protein